MIALFIGQPGAGVRMVDLAGDALARPVRHLKLVQSTPAPVKGDNGMLTVAGFCEQRGIEVSVRDMSRIGKRAAALSRKGGQIITRVQDVLFGEVNAYDPAVLEQAHEQISAEAS